MGPPSKSSKLRVGLVFIAGVLAGSMIIGTAGAHMPSGFDPRHVGRHVWRAFVNERAREAFFTKRQVRRNFLHKNAQAADAAKLGGRDPSDYQRACRQGAVHGSVYVDTLELTGTYQDLPGGFSCHGVKRARRTNSSSTGIFYVDLGHRAHVDFGCPRSQWQVTPTESSDSTVVHVDTVELGEPFQPFRDCVARVTVWHIGTPEYRDEDFILSLLN